MRSAFKVVGLSVVGMVVAAACGGSPVSSKAPAVAAQPSEQPTTSCARVRTGGAQRASLDARQGGSVALARAGDVTVAYVADEDEHALRTMDIDSRVERAVTPLDGAPAQVIVLGDGRVAVTLRDANRVQVFEPRETVDAPLEARCSVATPSEPVGLATTRDDATLLVTTAWGKKLVALDATTLGKKFDVDLGREPRAVTVDGDRAFVAHVVGAKMSVVDLATEKHAVREIDLRVRKTSGPKLRSGCQGFALAKSVEAEDDKAPIVVEKPAVKGEIKKPIAAPKGRVFAPMVTVDPGEPQVASAGYGSSLAGNPTESPVVSVVDSAAERTLAKTLISDEQSHGKECLLPRAAAATTAGTLLVTCLGIDQVVEMDARGADPSRLERRRWTVPAGPTGVAIDAHAARAVVWSQFDRELAVMDLASSDSKVVIVQPSWTKEPKLSPQLAFGRKLFHRTDDPRISQDGRACASCHPDGREDALTWSTPEGPRQTIMLAGRVATSAPYGWIGAHRDLKEHVTNTFERLGGIGLPGAAKTAALIINLPPGVEAKGDALSVPVPSTAELDALLAYVSSMPGPRLEGAVVDPEQERLAARGKQIFFGETEGCATCHLGGPGTDQGTHDVGSAIGADKKRAFDTPSLRFVGGTAPYFHDGRYSTLEELLGNDGKMGHTLELSHDDRTALEAYLETL